MVYGSVGLPHKPRSPRQEKKYAEAKAEYDEGIKRNPKEPGEGEGRARARPWVCLKMEYCMSPNGNIFLDFIGNMKMNRIIPYHTQV